MTIKSANKVVKHIVDGPTGTFMGTRTVDAFIDSPISDFEPIPVKDFAITYGFHSDYFTCKNLFIARDQTIQPHDYQKRFFSYTIPTLRKVTGKSKLYVFDAATAAVTKIYDLPDCKFNDGGNPFYQFTDIAGWVEPTANYFIGIELDFPKDSHEINFAVDQTFRVAADGYSYAMTGPLAVGASYDEGAESFVGRSAIGFQ